MAFHFGTTGIAEAKEFCSLVERLAKRIVEGGAKPDVVVDAADTEQLGVTTGHQQQQIGRFQSVCQAWRQSVGLKVVDGNERQTASKGDGLARHHAHQQAADETRPCRRGDGID